MNLWIRQMFDSAIARRCGVVRRKLSSIDQYASRSAVQNECRTRGFHIVEHGDQWLIFCDTAQVKIVL